MYVSIIEPEVNVRMTFTELRNLKILIGSVRYDTCVPIKLVDQIYLDICNSVDRLK